MPVIGTTPLQGYYYNAGNDTLYPLAGTPGAQGVPGISQFGLTITGDATANITLTAMAAAEDYFNGTPRYTTKVDLANYTQCRLIVRKMTVAGAAASKIMLKYSTTNPANAFSAAAWTASGAEVALNATNVTLDSGWINMPTGMMVNDVFIVPTQSGGDGSAAPVLGGSWVFFRNPGGLGATDTRGFVAYVEQTAQQTGITTVTDLAGLTVGSFPVVAGRRYKISWKANMTQVGSGGIAEVVLTDASNVQLTTSAVNMAAGAFADFSGFIVKTYATGFGTAKLRARTSAGSLTTNNSATLPISILVEDIG